MTELFYFEKYRGEIELPHMLSLIEVDLSEPYSVYTYRYFLNEWPHLTYTCKLRSSGEIIGCIIGKAQLHKKGKHRGYIGMLAVHPQHRRHRIGMLLVRTLLAQMCLLGVQEVVLETEQHNAAALAFYERLEFFRDKFLPRYYFNGANAYRLKYFLE